MAGPETPSILIVDDNDQMRAYLGVILQAGGYDVAFAADGFEALNEIKHRAPDLVLLDLTMPILDGNSMLELFKLQPNMSKTPVLVLTGRDGDADRERTMELGAAGFLTKPISAAVLLEAVSQHAPLGVPV
jgi:CheY-like chemotaxis protein